MLEEIKEAVAKLCQKYGSKYWQELDEINRYPTEFVEELTKGGYLSVLIPTEYGGSGLGIEAASLVLEEIHAQGANGGACHAQMYTMGTLLRWGNEEQKAKYLPQIAEGKKRLQAFAVTEPSTGINTTALKTFAEKTADGYVINGQKVWTSRAEHSDLMILLARTTKLAECTKKTDGISVFIVEMDKLKDNGMTIEPIKTMINHSTTEIFFSNAVIPHESLIGEEGKGFKYILSGMNAERILIAAECLGDSRWFIGKSRDYACERVVFDRPIGKNQGVQFPIANAYAQYRAATLMQHSAVQKYDAQLPCGEEANMAKLLASEASWLAADVCMQTYGGFGFANEYDVERKFRENRLYRIAPIPNNLILSYLAEHVLHMPRSY